MEGRPGRVRAGEGLPPAGVPVVAVVLALVLHGTTRWTGAGAAPLWVSVALWTVFTGLRADAVQRRLAGGDLGRRTVRRFLLAAVVMTAALGVDGLTVLLPAGLLVVTAVHVQWDHRRGLRAGLVLIPPLSAAALVLVHVGVLPTAVTGAPLVVTAVVGVLLAGMAAMNLAVMAAQGERDAAEVAALRREREEELDRAAHHDTLTGLLDRRGLDRALRSRAEGTQGRLPTGSVVVFVDLDGFKPVNDVHGHDAGDEVLAAVARGLRAAAPADAAVARPGGDEFVVVTTAATEDDLRDLVRRLRAAATVAVPWRDGAVAVGASTGAARAEVPTAAPELLRRADAAMYADKVRAHGTAVPRQGAATSPAPR